MLPQALNRHGEAVTRRRGDGATRGRGEEATRGRGDAVTRGSREGPTQRHSSFALVSYRRVSASHLLRVFLVGILAGILLLSCGSKPTDPRTVIPGDALVYLETADLAKTLKAITDNPKFQQHAKSIPDVSALNGVKFAIAVTGFETTEQQVTEEGFVGKIIPRFVVAAETNAWNWQTTSFVENQLGEFVNQAYGGEVVLETTPHDDGKSYIWTSPEGRKAYALQQGSLVFFGNDESAIDRCQAVKRGEVESIAKNPKIPSGDHLAFGYVAPDGIGQIANLAAISFAMGASEEDEVKSFVARVLPEILRNSIKELTWTASRTGEGIEDKINITLDDDSSRVFSETLVPGDSAGPELADLVPGSAMTATRYLLRDPQVAWRSVILTVTKKTDETSGSLIGAFSGSLFESYGIEDPELFLSSVGTQLITAKLSPADDEAVVITTVKDLSKLKSSLAKEVDLTTPAEKHFEADVWKSKDGELAAAFVGDTVIVGDAELVLKCVEAKNTGPNPALRQQFSSSDAVTITSASENDSFGKIVEVLAERKDESALPVLPYRTETRVNKNGIVRRTTSDFGLVGSIIVQLAGEE